MITLLGEGTVERDGERIVAITTDGTAILLERIAGRLSGM
jgi:hypothetical protein